MNEALVSIIVPVFNVEEYLVCCLNSLINQTYPNIEIICIDDGSTDSSSKILAQYKKQDSKIKVISTENHGQACARNLGLKNASGELVMFVDSDDWLDLNCIETVLKKNFFDKPEVNWVCFGARKVINTNSLTFRSYSRNSIQAVNDTLALQLSPEPWAKLYRTNFLRANNICFPQGLWYEDMTFYWACVSYAHLIGVIDDVFYNYRIRSDSTMGNSKKKTLGMGIHHLYNLEAIHKIWSENKYLEKHRALYEYIFELYVQQAFKFLCDEDRYDFTEKLKSLTDTLCIQPQRLSLTYDLIHNNRIMPFKYKWARSIRKRILKL